MLFPFHLMAYYKTKRPVKKTAKKAAPPEIKKHRLTIFFESIGIPSKYLKWKGAILLLCGLIVLFVIAYKWKKEPLEKPRDVSKTVSPADVQAEKEPAEAVTGLPEIVSIKLSPSSPKRGDAIKAEVLTRDNNAASIAYQWSMNGEILPETSDTLSGEFKRGDKIYLTANTFNGKDKGMPVTVLTHIFNAAPIITSTIKDAKFSENVFTYQIKAEDRDNDMLTYFLLDWPDYMTIDPKTGLIQWAVPSGFKGKAKVMLSVNDGMGGEAKQIFNLQINK